MQNVKFATQTKKLVLCALFTAMVTLSTMVFQIPMPFGIGYINLGDAFVLLSAYLLGPIYGCVAAGVGAGLADLLTYAMYAPGTFVIKALMALAAYFIYRALSKAFKRDIIPLVVAGVVAELIMTGGYFFYEGVCLGYSWGAAANIPFNLIQGAFGIILSVLVSGILYGRDIIKRPFDATKKSDEDEKEEKTQE